MATITIWAFKHVRVQLINKNVLSAMKACECTLTFKAIFFQVVLLYQNPDLY